MQLDPETIDSLNDCQIHQMEQAGNSFNPAEEDSSEKFSTIVRNVQAMIVYMYQATAFTAIREADPAKAAERWKQMQDLCEKALGSIKKLRDKYPHCGTPSLYDLTLYYWEACSSRYRQNMEDAECAKSEMNLPSHLFPKTT